MKNIFDIKRFGKYFLYDLNNARNTFGISGLITALSPVLTFVVFTAICFLANGSMEDYPVSLQVFLFLFLNISLVITFTTKAYGSLTEKRLGSDWLMIPASGVEKTLSMILISCFVVPAIVGSIFFAVDWILSNCFSTYPLAIISSINIKEEVSPDIMIATGNFMLSGWCCGILTFLLGAIFFKKAKAGKTILTCFGISIAISTLFAFFFSVVLNNDAANLEAFFNNLYENFDAVKAARIGNIILNCLCLIGIAVPVGLIYLRVKTLKH